MVAAQRRAGGEENQSNLNPSNSTKPPGGDDRCSRQWCCTDSQPASKLQTGFTNCVETEVAVAGAVAAADSLAPAAADIQVNDRKRSVMWTSLNH